MKDNNYVLAMYDIRGKQDFIYKSNKMKEIVGASYMIRDCFEDYLYPAAEMVSQKIPGKGKGLFCYKKESGSAEFSRESFQHHLEDGYIGEVVYDGGGNFFVLYEKPDDYRETNRIFYRAVLEGTYSMRVLSSCIVGVDFDDYQGDQRKIYAVHRQNEQKEDAIHPVNSMPFVQVDYRSSLPLSEKLQIGRDKNGEAIVEKVSCETSRKYKKYAAVMEAHSSSDRVIEGQRILDNLVTEKGEESLLAVIYIDGNNMGAQVENCLGGLKNGAGEADRSYEACVNALRKFSEEIQVHYIDKRIQNVDALLDKMQEEKKKISKRRFVVYAGDEITFICNARSAFAVAAEYLKKLADESPEGALRTSCAGIAIFHSHAPFADAYRIAEECCESGKQWMKKQGIKDASLIDFHYCQGAIGISLEEIRKQEGTEENSRPWLIRGSAEAEEKLSVTETVVEEMKKELQKAGRGNLKNLMFSAKRSMAEFRQELERIRAHQAEKKIDFSLGGKLDDETVRRLIYDMATVYDLWFRETDTKEA